MDFVKQQEILVKVQEQSQLYKQIQTTKEVVGTRRRAVRRQLRMSDQQKKMDIGQKYNYSLWGAEENASYMRFLAANHQLFKRSHTDRRMMKINVRMSMWIKTRSPDQCRSHHQKMMKYHSDIPTIVNYIHEYTGASIWEETVPPVKVEQEKVAKIEEGASSNDV